MPLRKLTKLLLAKSEQSFLLGLEIFNKPTVLYRIESFCFYFTNAWELLMKAYLIESSKNTKVVFLKKKPGEERKSISLDMCIGRIFTDASDPVRQNIIDIAELRNKATHLVIPELETIYTGLFQRGVLHYVEFYKKWTGKTLSITPRMLTLVFDFDPEEVSKITIKGKYGKEVSAFFEQTQKQIVKNIESFGSDYSVVIHSKLALVKNPKKADIVLSSGANSVLSATIVEVAKDPAKTHPLLIDKVASLIKELSKSTKLARYEVLAIRHIEKIDENSRPDLIYKDKVHKNASPQYSQAFVDLAVDKFEADPQYLEKAVTKYKRYIKEKSLAKKAAARKK
jgi:uncharacterized protein DUF3644